jgi:hypothetical protein
MVITTALIRIALYNICKTTHGQTPRVIPVTALGGSKHRLFGALIPVEYRRKVYQYLAVRLGLSLSSDDDILLLAPKEAAALIGLGFPQAI